MVGVDIDDTLVRSAWKRRRIVWSLQEPAEDENPPTTLALESDGKKRKRRSDSDGPVLHTQGDYFPSSCEHMFGSLPIPPSSAPEHGKFPHNVTFRTANWVDNEIPEDADLYDIVLAWVPSALQEW